MDDGDRPPVLAHQRFAAARADLAGLELAARFERIHAVNLWGAATSVSGLGSEPAAVGALAAELPALLRALQARSMLDAPCGDARWINRLALDVDYTGIDIVPALIVDLQRRAVAGELRGRYLRADITRDPLPRADAVLCRDALVHLSFAHIARAIDNLRRSGARLADHHHVHWVAAQQRLRRRRLARAQPVPAAVQLAGTARAAGRALRRGRRRIPRQEPGCLAARCAVGREPSYTARWLHPNKETSMAMTAPVWVGVWAPRAQGLLRIVVGYLFLTHGTAKLFHVPHVAMFDNIQLMSLIGLAGVIEVVGGLLVLIGLFTRPAAFIMSGEMAFAYFMAHAAQGNVLVPMLNQGESAVLFCFVFLFFAAAGAGAWGIDTMRAAPRA